MVYTSGDEHAYAWDPDWVPLRYLRDEVFKEVRDQDGDLMLIKAALAGRVTEAVAKRRSVLGS